MRLGLNGGFPVRHVSDVTPAFAQSLRALDVRGLRLDVTAGPGESVFETTTPAYHQVRNVLADAGIRVVHTGGGAQRLIAADESERRQAARVLAEACRAAGALGAQAVLTGCGSADPRGAYVAHPYNWSQQAFDQLVQSLREVAVAAEANGVQIALEPHQLTTLSGPRRTRELIEATGSAAVRLNLDIVNWVTLETYFDTPRLITEAIAEIGAVTISAHLKDVVLEPRLVTHIDERLPGEGTLDWVVWLRALDQLLPEDGYALLDHASIDKAPAAFGYIRRIAAEAGVRWTEAAA